MFLLPPPWVWYIIMTTSLVISAVPDIPQDVSAFKVSPSSEGNCIIVVNWNPPSNANTTLVKQYMVESPFGNLTTMKTAVSVIYDCEVESDAQIGIYTVDSCDRDGASSDNSIAELLETTNNSSGIVTMQPGIIIPTTSGIRKLKLTATLLLCN